MGLGNTTNQPFPVQIGTDTDWDKISAGALFAIALKTNGSLWAWGDNSYGQFGNGTTTSSTVPVYIPVTGCSLGIGEFTAKKNSLVLSPNPSKNHVSITYDSPGVTPVMEVYSILGKKITDYKAVAASGSWELTTTELPTGVYIVVMKERDVVLMQQKLVVE